MKYVDGRLFSDRPDTVQIRWYAVSPSRPVLPYPSFVANEDMQDDNSPFSGMETGFPAPQQGQALTHVRYGTDNIRDAFNPRRFCGTAAQWAGDLQFSRPGDTSVGADPCEDEPVMSGVFGGAVVTTCFEPGASGMSWVLASGQSPTIDYPTYVSYADGGGEVVTTRCEEGPPDFADTLACGCGMSLTTCGGVNTAPLCTVPNGLPWLWSEADGLIPAQVSGGTILDLFLDSISGEYIASANPIGCDTDEQLFGLTYHNSVGVFAVVARLIAYNPLLGQSVYQTTESLGQLAAVGDLLLLSWPCGTVYSDPSLPCGCGSGLTTGAITFFPLAIGGGIAPTTGSAPSGYTGCSFYPSGMKGNWTSNYTGFSSDCSTLAQGSLTLTQPGSGCSWSVVIGGNVTITMSVIGVGHATLSLSSSTPLAQWSGQCNSFTANGPNIFTRTSASCVTSPTSFTLTGS